LPPGEKRREEARLAVSRGREGECGKVRDKKSVENTKSVEKKICEKEMLKSFPARTTDARVSMVNALVRRIYSLSSFILQANKKLSFLSLSLSL